jgi:hypothetical protein
MKKPRKISESSIVPVISDGAIATHEIGEGRMVPVLVVDCSEKVELRDLIYAHEYSPPGDVTVTWGTPKWSKNTVLLLLEFSKPSKLEVLLKFDLKKQGGVVDGILHANALYLQPSESGLKVVDGLDKGKIIVEIPDTGFLSKWEALYTSNLVKLFKKKGLSRRQAKGAAEQHKSMLREIWSKRMGRN